MSDLEFFLLSGGTILCLVGAGYSFGRGVGERSRRLLSGKLEQATAAWRVLRSKVDEQEVEIRLHRIAARVSRRRAISNAEKVAEQMKQNLALAERVAAQSELLSRAAERQAESDRRLGYLYPRGLETPPSPSPFPPSVEDALSPTWCKQESADGKFRAPGISEGS